MSAIHITTCFFSLSLLFATLYGENAMSDTSQNQRVHTVNEPQNTYTKHLLKEIARIRVVRDELIKNNTTKKKIQLLSSADNVNNFLNSNPELAKVLQELSPEEQATVLATLFLGQGPFIYEGFFVSI